MFGPVTGASALRQSTCRDLFHVRAGYADEAARIVRQLHEPKAGCAIDGAPGTTLPAG